MVVYLSTSIVLLFVLCWNLSTQVDVDAVERALSAKERADVSVLLKEIGSKLQETRDTVKERKKETAAIIKEFEEIKNSMKEVFSVDVERFGTPTELLRALKPAHDKMKEIEEKRTYLTSDPRKEEEDDFARQEHIHNQLNFIKDWIITTDRRLNDIKNLIDSVHELRHRKCTKQRDIVPECACAGEVEKTQNCDCTDRTQPSVFMRPPWSPIQLLYLRRFN